MDDADFTTIEHAYRQLASEWHGGQASPLYAYASTGTVTLGLCAEIYNCVCQLHPLEITHKARLERFYDYVEPYEDALLERRENCTNCEGAYRNGCTYCR